MRHRPSQNPVLYLPDLVRGDIALGPSSVLGHVCLEKEIGEQESGAPGVDRRRTD